MERRAGLDRPDRRILKWAAVIAVCLASFLYCLYYAETWGKYSEGYTPDEGNYIAMAQRLLSDGVYSFWGNGPDAYVSPGFPLFLTVCMKLFGADVQGIFCIKVVQGVLTALTVGLTFLLGYLLTKKYSVGILAAALLALNGSFAYYSRFLLTETLYFFTMMLFFVCFVYTVQRDKKWLHFLSGVLLCVCVMVRPLLVVVAPFLYIPFVLARRRDWKAALLPVALFAAGFVLTAAPWWVRNIVSLDKLVLLATQTNPIYAGLAQDVAALGLTDPGSFGGNIALLFQLLLRDPLGTLYWMTFGKFNIIFMTPPAAVYATIVTQLAHNAALYLGLLGFVRVLWSKALRWPAVVFGVYLLSTFAFVPVSRYALQYMPFLAIFTGYILTLVFRRKDGREA